MIRMALILVFTAILYLAFPATKPFAASHVRPPETSLENPSAITAGATEWSWIEIAAWVQAIGSIAAILVAIGVGWYSHRRDEKNRDLAERQHRQRVLSGLYVEVFLRAARCARDANTWRLEVRYENERHRGIPGFEQRRIIKNLLKFEPSPPVVYPALAESHGLLDPDAQAALSEFYYRLEAVTRDVRRFALKKWDADMEPDDTVHFAQVLHGVVCAPAQEAIKQLRAGLDDHAGLDRKLNESCRNMFMDPSPLGDTIDAVLAQFTNKAPPTIPNP